MHTRLLSNARRWAIISLLFFSAGATAATTYVTDQGHTEVLFGWNHAGVSQQHAEFTRATGTLELADEIEKSSVNVVIDASSLSSGVEALDKHLMNSDYLNVPKYPEITFQSTSVKQTGDKTFDVTGDLTLHGVTQPVTLKATMTHRGAHPVAKFIDYYKGSWIAFHATTEIDHMAFKVGAFSTGPISIEINTELKAK